MGRHPVTKPPAARFVATHSVLTMDARHPYTAKSLVDAQDMHRTVMSGFRGWVSDGDPDARAQMGVLSTWSVDLKAGALVLVVQSRVPGDWAGIPRGALTDKPHVITVDRTFHVGDSLTFRTVVNPIHSRPTGSPAPDRARGRRTAHTRPDHVKNWFVRRLQPLGDPRRAPDGVVRIGATTEEETLGIRMLPTVTSPRPHHGLRIVRAEIRGTLTVTDPAALVDSMSQGIGHARAYGCGLLLTR
ncbi:type I-E CRISPR-associated protein Cas6/Cse3/CasE (plasmid) [Streptomyces sp. NBC_01591]|uniref:type I-E CRISPR-associated protein Cas6/Cse3/CasE n=1 Tax=Streptomyces sp. NBC_01591 TaxID=2975888 RepID=UPI002DD9F5F0|nr:type I-E CRISPR-associated protein Cas6/Cse3/CasE [Streptomyces sp. NBC_01591]WSD74801.1 type I-E CRISPR-associated protein Cas6/Cse3/CasE [Streptomyces sp. NBC_01591]